MSDGKETDNVITKRITTFLLDKPVWVWWIFYVIVTGALFGLFYFGFFLLTIQWWAGFFVLLTTGIIWGSLKYNQRKKKIKKEVEVEIEETESE